MWRRRHMPQISVIVPVYKVEPYLHKCVDSILAQTFTDFELILVDDGSPDNCGKICDEYAEKDDRIIVIHQENGGLSAARNAGLDWVFANSNSEWIAFVDSDDYVADNYLELLYEAAKVNNADLAMCGFVYADSKGKIIDNTIHFEIKEYNRNESFKLLIDKWATAIACNKLYKKDLLEKIRYPEKKIHEDEFVIHHLLYNKKKLVTVSEQPYYYFQREDGIAHSENFSDCLDGFEALFDRYCFCKEKRLPFEKGVLENQFNKICNKKPLKSERTRFLIISKEYYKVLLTYEVKTQIKKKIRFFINVLKVEKQLRQK